jgi:hypothetical protein
MRLGRTSSRSVGDICRTLVDALWSGAANEDWTTEDSGTATI